MIMGCHIAERLNLSRKCLLFIAGGVALTTPISIGILTAPTLQAQSLADPPVSYVASIKPNKAMDVHTFSEYSASGRLTATGVTVASLLRIAYHIQPYQLIGAPAWISTKRYDINAKVDDNPPPSQQILLKALLRDRFKLLVHNETRELPIFALVVARRDGKLGPQLTKSAFDCAAYFAGPHAPPQPGHALNCATNIGPGSLFGKAIPMSQLATSLAPFVSRFTLDKTGLTGGFDVELTWSPDEVSPNITGNAPNDTAPRGSVSFRCLQEQRRLKLVSEKGPVRRAGRGSFRGTIR